jgi:hypothetical protein
MNPFANYVNLFVGRDTRAFSGEVGTGSPQKMRPLKDNWSEFRFQRNGIRSSQRGPLSPEDFARPVPAPGGLFACRAALV